LNGVVTILFTDLVGSTELFGRMGEGRADALRREHFAMLRAALAAHSGDEVKSIGDSVMAAFTSPARAIACAIEMQQRVDAVRSLVGSRGGFTFKDIGSLPLKGIDVSQPTASALVRELAEIGILSELTGKQRNRVFAYSEYLMLFPGAGSRE
jgi:class 3 adenylate cyclase